MFRISFINEKNLGQVVETVKCEDLFELAAAMCETNWAPGTFNEAHRTIKNFITTSLFVIDVDAGLTLEQAKTVFKDYQHVIGTSRNHQKEKHGVKTDRFRVAIPLDFEITSDEDFKATFNEARMLFPFLDEACKDASRFFYPCLEIISVQPEGKKLNKKLGESFLDRKIDIDLTVVHEGKGELWKSTLKLLQFGAAPGQRHAELIKAVGNLKEQGYQQEETINLLSDMASRVFDKNGWETPDLNSKDLKKIEDMYLRESKYEFTPQETEAPPFITTGDLLSETFEYLTNKDKVSGEPTGLEGLDKLLGGGFRTGEITALMAHAKTGKNALSHFLLHKFLSKSIPYGYGSRELSPATEVLPNLFTIETGSNAWLAKITDAYMDMMRKISSSWPLYFSPGYGYFPPEELKTWFKTLKSLGVNFFLFDHFHYSLLKEDYETTSTQIKMLKTLSKELDIHILLIIQPRSLRDDEKLSMSALRGGAAIGQAIDNLLILERIKDTEQTNISKLTLSDARHRLAKPGHIFLQYDPDSTTFLEVRKELIDAQLQDKAGKEFRDARRNDRGGFNPNLPKEKF